MQTLRLDCLGSWLKPRPADAHKGLYGRLCLVGGDMGMPGAVRIAGEAALRVGAGRVTVITRHAHVSICVTACPEMLCYGVDTLSDELIQQLSTASMIVMGPGLGQSDWSRSLFDAVMALSVPMLIDADGLNLLAQSSSIVPSSVRIVTPHPGEAARLLNCSVADVQANRTDVAVALQKRLGGVVVLKGHHTLVASAHHPIQCCQAGNPGMASAGMGDLLSGLVAGLFAQGLTLWQAACAGVVLHATAGDQVAQEKGQRGLLATDLFPAIRQLMHGFESKDRG